MSSELMLILDDASGQFNYSGGQWTLSTLDQWYSKTSYYPAFADSNATQFGSFTLTFEGTSIAFIGNTPQTVSALSQLAIVSIDGGKPYNITYGDLDPPSYIQWYQSPTLADGSHTISLGQLAGTAIDFALIKVGSNTSLSGKTIFVDDNDSAINYTGKWTRNTDRFISGILPHGYPAGNTTHTSSTPGDMIVFRFSGSSLSVYGIFSWANLGVLSATYSLDGSTVTNNLEVTTSTAQYLGNYSQASNVLMFSDNTIQPGDHTLIINITKSINQTFMLDYMTYMPSFSSLATMPNLTGTTTSAVNPSTSATQSIPLTQSSTAPRIHNDGNGTRAKTSAVVGGVVAGITFIAMLVFLLFFLLRKLRGKENNAQNNSTAAQTQHVHFLPPIIQQPPLSLDPPRGFIAIQPRNNSSHALTPFQPGLPTRQASGTAIELKRERANFDNEQRPRSTAAPSLGTTPQNDHSSRSDARRSTLIRADLDTRTFVDSEPPAYDGLSMNHLPNSGAAEN